MDGKVGQVVDIAMPIGAAAMSTYGPSYAAGARTGAALWDQNRELYRQKKQGARMADLLDDVAEENLSAQQIYMRNAAAPEIEQGLAEPGEDGNIYRVQPGPWAPGQQPRRLADEYTAKPDPNIALAREMFKAGNIAGGNALLSQINQETSKYRTGAVQMAYEKDMQDSKMTFDRETQDIGLQAQQALQTERLAAERTNVMTQVTSQNHRHMATMLQNADQWEQKYKIMQEELGIARERLANSDKYQNLNIKASLINNAFSNTNNQVRSNMAMLEPFISGQLDWFEEDPETGDYLKDENGANVMNPQAAAASQALADLAETQKSLNAQYAELMNEISPGKVINDDGKPIVVTDKPRTSGTDGPSDSGKEGPGRAVAGTAAAVDDPSLIDKYSAEINAEADRLADAYIAEAGGSPDLNILTTKLSTVMQPVDAANYATGRIKEYYGVESEQAQPVDLTSVKDIDRVGIKLVEMRRQGKSPQDQAATLVELGIPSELAWKITNDPNLLYKMIGDARQEAAVDFAGKAAAVAAGSAGDVYNLGADAGESLRLRHAGAF